MEAATMKASQTNQQRFWIGAVMMLIGAFLFALKGVFIKTCYKYGVDTITVLAWRMLSSAPLYVATLFWDKQKRPDAEPISTKQWLTILWLGFIGYYVSAFLNFHGLHFITASLERVVLFVYPTFVLLINRFYFQKPITWLQVVALLITYTGIFIAFQENLHASQQVNIMLGVGLVVASGLTYAFYMVGGDQLIPKVGIWRFTSLSMLVAAVMMLIHAWVVNGKNFLQAPQPVIMICCVMGVVSTFIPTLLYAEGIKRVGSTNASILGSIGPIFTIILASTFLDEDISAIQILGTFIVLVGVFLIGFKGKK
jgi:drug/metabolite transporter (DMT)-like permease